ncbi:bis-aminopropyl spermidine synthase family protein [Bailinhaonella thermotolerans]|uniref:bis-aminopropyl spermidine synthase family protein n=1 Tax=Bailinhaonella thermotolerans TaxID=1070861 RepID=UPI001F5B161F|nr:bis-aminopropyl spermidine synthase family protein [Bailinhaonella thermotolerans]
MSGTGHEELSLLLEEAAADSRRLRHALAALTDGRWRSLGELVREAATSRRSVEALLRAVELERQGELFRVPPARAAAYRRLTAVSGLADPVSHLVDPALVARVEKAIAAGPAALASLDHVSATAETVVRRALLLRERFWMPGARLLCVGDHDLTSVAVALVCPEAEVTVVDVDDRVLAHIDAQGLPIRTRWADLRLGLPASAAAWADLAISDPPYTPEGMGLFALRALEGLRDRERGRLLMAYGASERTPALALKVQNAFAELNLAIEAMWPDFNRYHGAEAIGSAADLYVLRPTAKTWPAVAARGDRVETRIYTHGPQSIEAGERPEAWESAGEPDLLVGDWPASVLPRLPRVRLSTWLAKPYKSDPRQVAVTLPAGLGAALPRVLLATRADRVRVRVEPRETPPGLAALVSPVYSVRPVPGGVEAVRLPRPAPGTAEEAVRRVLDAAHGKLLNTWREALIALARARGETLTKNEAKAAVLAAAPWAADTTVLDLPAHRLRALPAAIAGTAAP